MQTWTFSYGPNETILPRLRLHSLWNLQTRQWIHSSLFSSCFFHRFHQLPNPNLSSLTHPRGVLQAEKDSDFVPHTFSLSLSGYHPFFFCLDQDNKIHFYTVKLCINSSQKSQGHSNHTWRPVMTTDTTTPSYWLNWRFLLCAIWILGAMVVSSILIWRYEGFDKSKEQRESQRKKVGALYKDEAWRTCSKRIHPVWLLAYRVIGCSILLAVLIGDVVLHSARIFYFYTEWTFTLVTIYFGLASIFSIHGCLHHHNEVREGDFIDSDAERGTYMAPTVGENGNMPTIPRISNSHREPHARKSASVWGYAFQIIFQTSAGAVVLTDTVFWLVLYPFISSKNDKLNFMKVCMHSVNAVVLLGDVILNGLHFPFFRVAYFVLWTSIFVIFQWIIHACVSMWWPYPFLDLSSPYAPIWYLAVGLLTIPCFGVFALIIKIKKCCWSGVLPE